MLEKEFDKYPPEESDAIHNLDKYEKLNEEEEVFSKGTSWGLKFKELKNSILTRGLVLLITVLRHGSRRISTYFTTFHII